MKLIKLIQILISGLIREVYIYVCSEAILDSILKISYNYRIIFLYLNIGIIIYFSALNSVLKRLHKSIVVGINIFLFERDSEPEKSTLCQSYLTKTFR